MNCDQQGEQGSVEPGRQKRLNFSLRNTTVALLLEVGFLGAAHQAAADPATPDQQKKSRSNFEYHDGRAEEKRPYRRPDLDIDPTNLKLEELRARINALEERLEQLEYQSIGSRKVR